MLRLACLLLALRCALGTVYSVCSHVDVVASVPCLALGANPTEEKCRLMSDRCCVLIKQDGETKCFRRKNVQPDSGNRCLQAPILINKPTLNQFLEGDDVILETKTVSELQCWDFCLRQVYCKAYNYQNSMGEALKTCQLLSSDIGIPVPRKDFTYHSFEQTEDMKILLGNMCR